MIDPSFVPMFIQGGALSIVAFVVYHWTTKTDKVISNNTEALNNNSIYLRLNLEKDREND